MMPCNVTAHPRSHPLRPSQVCACAQVARVDVASQPVPGSFDRHSHLEGPLHFQADKNRDWCFNWEIKEEAKFEARGVDEGERDHLARKRVEVRARTICHCLDSWCHPHGLTLQQLEDCKIIFKVSCCWQVGFHGVKPRPAGARRLWIPWPVQSFCGAANDKRDSGCLMAVDRSSVVGSVGAVGCRCGGSKDPKSKLQRVMRHCLGRCSKQ